MRISVIYKTSVEQHMSRSNLNRLSADEEQSGSNGGRLGVAWRITVVFIATALIWLFIGYVYQSVFGSGYDRLGHVINAVLATVLTVPVVVLARRFLDKRPLAGLGLSPLQVGWRSFFIGMGCYLIPAGIGLGAALVLGWVEISLTTSLSNFMALLIGLVVLVLLYEALPEELVFRGYIYRNLNMSLPRWIAVGGQALLFTLWGIAIGASLTVDRIVFFFLVAIVIGMIRAITGDVWACVGFHLAFQTVQQLFSGGWAADAFAVSAPQTLEQFVFGLIPISLAILVLEIIVRKDTDWRACAPESAPIERE